MIKNLLTFFDDAKIEVLLYKAQMSIQPRVNGCKSKQAFILRNCSFWMKWSNLQWTKKVNNINCRSDKPFWWLVWRKRLYNSACFFFVNLLLQWWTFQAFMECFLWSFGSIKCKQNSFHQPLKQRFWTLQLQWFPLHSF